MLKRRGFVCLFALVLALCCSTAFADDARLTADAYINSTSQLAGINNGTAANLIIDANDTSLSAVRRYDGSSRDRGACQPDPLCEQGNHCRRGLERLFVAAQLVE